MKYCEIIDQDSIAEFIGDLEVTASGGPTARTGGRLIQCSISASSLGAFGKVLNVETLDLWDSKNPTSDR